LAEQRPAVPGIWNNRLKRQEVEAVAWQKAIQSAATIRDAPATNWGRVHGPATARSPAAADEPRHRNTYWLQFNAATNPAFEPSASSVSGSEQRNANSAEAAARPCYGAFDPGTSEARARRRDDALPAPNKPVGLCRADAFAWYAKTIIDTRNQTTD